MRIIRFEDDQKQVRYGFDRDVVRDGVAGDQAELLKGDPSKEKDLMAEWFR